jgi:hypothetical protein
MTGHTSQGQVGPMGTVAGTIVRDERGAMKRRTRRPTRSRTSNASVPVALVVSEDPARRGWWARFLERGGLRVLRCAGPRQAACALLLGGQRCPLHEAADVAFYDNGLDPEFIARLSASGAGLPIAFVEDRVDDAGRHIPEPTAVCPSGPTSLGD